MKKLFLFLCALLMICQCAVAANAEAANEYTVFAVKYGGYTVVPDAIGLTSALTLGADQQGKMDFAGDSMDITKWTLEGEAFSLEMADGSTASGILRNGALELDLYGDGSLLLYYAAPGADLSGYTVMSAEEFFEQYAADQAAKAPSSSLYAFSRSLDSAAGLHLVYSAHQDYMDADQDYDVQGRGGMYYSRRTTRVSGLESTSVTLFRDGTAYNLDPDKKTGIKVTSTSVQAVNEDALIMDDLYSAVVRNAERTDFTQETREVDGKEYAAEVFPARAEYESAYTFCFDGEGMLAYCEEVHPDVGEIHVGASFYTLKAIDGAVDDALFELGGYTITE